MPRAGYLCTMGACFADCEHGVACVVFRVGRDHPHPTERGREQHYGWNGQLNHTWNGKAGRCHTEVPTDD